MPNRSGAEAAQSLLTELRRAFSCVSGDVLIDARRNQSEEHPRTVFLPRRTAPLGGRAGFDLVVSHEYTVERGPSARSEWSARTLGYRYALNLHDGPELLAFHWHPDDPNPIKFPHLHLSAGAQVQFAALARAHIPTGLVELKDALRMAIEDLGVRPLRPDWSNVLSALPQ
jgi:hypothetical protein